MSRNRYLVITVVFMACAAAAADAVYMANGIKMGEVTPDSVLVWTRLTRAAERNADGAPFPEVAGKERAGGDLSVTDITGGRALEDMEGAAPGAPGLVRVTYWPEEAPESKVQSDWQPVDDDRDYTRYFPLTGLNPGTGYVALVEGKPVADGEVTCRVEGRFRTAPLPEEPAEVNFVVVTCGDYPRRDDPDRGHKIYDAMLKLDPDFFVHTGDIEYYDKALPWGPAPELARFKWNRFYAMPFQRTFHRNVASYFMKDDHDTLMNDCWPGQRYGALTWEQGLALFREQAPVGEKPYRTFRWGKDLQIWLVEGRDFRSPNTMRDGPDKSIWGPEQKAWFKRTVQESDATFRVLISPTPLVGPDRENKNDNHANEGFAHEGKELRQFMAARGNMIVINGDRHWQYVSVDDDTGLREFGTGPHSNEHASGWKQEDVRPEHQYLKLQGGFLQVNVIREEGIPKMILRHRDVDGTICNEVTLPDPK
ncbi:MAG TPA: alkaline phosphatase D family protein [Candidatus Hydrogenedentes bacterium]|nr:alkaline phosphatase D family protein [Candidatus Hydrogenedentota bacterium]